MSNIDTVDVIRHLIEGGFVCEVTQPEAYYALRDSGEIDAVREDVDAALGYHGMVLKASSDHRPEYFYAAPEAKRLNSDGDMGFIRKELKSIISDATGCIGFMELVDKATGVDTLPNAGFSFDLGEMQSSLANTGNTALLNLFLQVRHTKYFKSALSNKHKNDKERLDAMFAKLSEDKLIADDGTGVNYAFTGKFSHYISVIEYIRDAISSESEESNFADSQTSLLG